MNIVGKIRDYVLYKIDSEDVDINSSSGSRYIKNSILIFSTNEKEIKCGNEIIACKDSEEAKKFIEENASKQSIHDIFQIAKERADKEASNKDRIREEYEIEWQR